MTSEYTLTRRDGLSGEVHVSMGCSTCQRTIGHWWLKQNQELEPRNVERVVQFHRQSFGHKHREAIGG